jgi:hypothetical protein
LGRCFHPIWVARRAEARKSVPRQYAERDLSDVPR